MQELNEQACKLRNKIADLEKLIADHKCAALSAGKNARQTSRQDLVTLDDVNLMHTQFYASERAKTAVVHESSLIAALEREADLARKLMSNLVEQISVLRMRKLIGADGLDIDDKLLKFEKTQDFVAYTREQITERLQPPPADPNFPVDEVLHRVLHSDPPKAETITVVPNLPEVSSTTKHIHMPDVPSGAPSPGGQNSSSSALANSSNRNTQLAALRCA